MGTGDLRKTGIKDAKDYLVTECSPPHLGNQEFVHVDLTYKLLLDNEGTARTIGQRKHVPISDIKKS